MAMARLIFMGTPDFAVPSLAALIQAKYDIVAVVTQPDAPAGRGRQLKPSPVKLLAQQHGLPILQPDSLKSPEVVEALRALAPDVIVVAAYGQILRQDVLDLPKHHCLNVHASLLPRWRGASPISAAIAAGDAITGVTIMLMEAGLDSGPILAQREEPIRPDDTTGTLTERLAHVGAELLVATLPKWLAGQITPQKQDESRVTLAGRLKKEDGKLDWSRSAAELERHVRAMSPWPSAFTTWQGQQLKVLRAELGGVGHREELPNGAVVLDRDHIYVKCGDGEMLRLTEVQLEGKRAMDAEAFARGHPALAGSVLGA
ncbi:MAG: methionyl-tRNA formyltransferase [Anaerolineae bacterium]|nr:methionyl-tRNA formyltransferase [Anaerolineae bacterium]